MTRDKFLTAQSPPAENDLIDTLIAISVISKRLAARIRQENGKGGITDHEQNERVIPDTGRADHLWGNTDKNRKRNQKTLYRNNPGGRQRYPENSQNQKAAKEKPAETAPPKEPTTTSPSLKKEDVRAVLAEKSSKGFKAEIKDLLKKYGATQLKQVNPVDYEALINDARQLGKPEVNDHA